MTPRQRHGAPVVLVIWGAVDQYSQFEDLLTCDDEYLMPYKDSHVRECDMVAVAVCPPAPSPLPCNYDIAR